MYTNWVTRGEGSTNIKYATDTMFGEIIHSDQKLNIAQYRVIMTPQGDLYFTPCLLGRLCNQAQP